MNDDYPSPPDGERIDAVVASGEIVRQTGSPQRHKYPKNQRFRAPNPAIEASGSQKACLSSDRVTP